MNRRFVSRICPRLSERKIEKEKEIDTHTYTHIELNKYLSSTLSAAVIRLAQIVLIIILLKKNW
jgi:hypothetical protein